MMKKPSETQDGRSSGDDTDPTRLFIDMSPAAIHFSDSQVGGVVLLRSTALPAVRQSGSIEGEDAGVCSRERGVSVERQVYLLIADRLRGERRLVSGRRRSR